MRADDQEDVVVVGPAGAEVRSAAGEGQTLLELPERRSQLRFEALVDRGLASIGRPRSALEQLGLDVVHFPYQAFVPTRLPTLFNPHDLLHLHLPELLSPEDRRRRAAFLSVACRRATIVVAESAWARDDLVDRLGLDREKVHAVQRGAPTEFYPAPDEQALAACRTRYELPSRFCLYPAVTWPHKNHARLLDALAHAERELGTSIALVCTGSFTDDWHTLRERVEALGLGDRVRFLGRVAEHDLRALYRLARFVVFPSLFEGGGFPVVEALAEGTPVICSDLPPLREYGGDAIVTFDPRSVEDIARALASLTLDDELRGSLAARGLRRAGRFRWGPTAARYRALYRVAAEAPLSPGDEELLASTKSPSA